MDHTLVLTCAGLSSRFPNRAPKWALTHPSGDMMAIAAIGGIKEFTRLVILIREDHSGKYTPEAIKEAFQYSEYYGAEVFVVPNTSDRVATVEHYVRNHHEGGAFTVKDCDNYFMMNLSIPMEQGGDSWVAVAATTECGRIDPGNRSYAEVVQGGYAMGFKERTETPTAYFCSGAYGWRDPEVFLANIGGCESLSEVLGRCVSSGFTCRAYSTPYYVDWGTLEDWKRFTSEYRTLFVDIDGVIFKAGHRHFAPVWGDNAPIPENIAELRRLYDEGKTHIVLTTSRNQTVYSRTIKQLADAEVPYHRLVMGLPVCPRVLINDIVTQRGERPHAQAINIERNSPFLKEHLQSL